jgi:hypothetical protein
MLLIDDHIISAGGRYGLGDYCRGDDADMPVEAAIRVHKFSSHGHRHCWSIPLIMEKRVAYPGKQQWAKDAPLGVKLGRKK